MGVSHPSERGRTGTARRLTGGRPPSALWRRRPSWPSIRRAARWRSVVAGGDEESDSARLSILRRRTGTWCRRRRLGQARYRRGTRPTSARRGTRTSDILAWNADGTSLPARLHEQFLKIFGKKRTGPARSDAGARHSGPPEPGSPGPRLSAVLSPTISRLGTGAAGRRNCSPGRPRSCSVPATQPEPGEPPGNPKASFWTGRAGPRPTGVGAAAQRHTGSWWEPWVEWMLERSGGEVEAPTAPGSVVHPAVEPAPGLRVFDRIGRGSVTA
jgi:hypothetical protein